MAMVDGFARAGADIVVASRKAEACAGGRGRGRQGVRRGDARGTRATSAAGLPWIRWPTRPTTLRQGRRPGQQRRHVAALRLASTEVSEELFDKVVGVNLKGPFRLSALVGTRMAAGGGGSIINISSMGAPSARADILPYAAAKAGLNAITDRHRARLRPEGPGQRDHGRHVPDRRQQGVGRRGVRRGAEAFALGRAGEPRRRSSAPRSTWPATSPATPPARSSPSTAANRDLRWPRGRRSVGARAGGRPRGGRTGRRRDGGCRGLCELVRDRVTSLLGLGPSAQDDWRSSSDLDERDRALLGFVEQFVFSVSTMGDDEVAALLDHVSPEQLHELSNVGVGRRPDGTAGPGGRGGAGMNDAPRIPLPTDPSVPKYGTPIDFAVADFAAAVIRQRALDPALTELVRLRCARVHDCRLCRSIRNVEAGDLDEETAAKIDRYETSDLDERAKVALRLTDAMILDPSSADATRCAPTPAGCSARSRSPSSCSTSSKWSQQKASVALRIEVPPRDGLSELRFDDQGRATVGGALV